MMINVGLLEQTWGYAQEHPEEYKQDAWGFRSADGTVTHDLAGLALKLLGAKFVWTPVADYPPSLMTQAVWGTNDVVFSTLPRAVGHAIAQWVTQVPTDRYADYFWHAVVTDRCPIGLAARVALGIDSADALVLFEEDAKPFEIQLKMAELLARGRKQWEREHATASGSLSAALEASGVNVTHVTMVRNAS